MIITCDDVHEGREAIRKLRAETECNEKNLRLMECDLCSLDSVRQFAELFNNEEARLDVLICNSSLMWSTHVVTKHGFNTIIQANYLSHFLLTNLLLHKLKQCRPSRIINVSSGAHQSLCNNNFPADHLSTGLFFHSSCSKYQLVRCIDSIPKQSSLRCLYNIESISNIINI